MRKVQTVLLIALLFLFPLVYWTWSGGQEYIWSKSSLIGIGLLLVFATYAVAHPLRRSRQARLTLPLWLLFLSGVVSAAAAVNHFKSFEVLTLWLFGLGLYTAVLWSEVRVQLLLRTLLTAGTLVAVYGLLQFSGALDLPTTQYGEPDPASSFGLSNFSSEFLLPLVPLVAGQMRTARRKGRWLAAAGLLVMLAYIAAGQTRAAFVGLAAATTMAAAVALARWAKATTSQSACIILVGLSVIPFRDPSILSRIESWRAAVKIFSSSWLLGVGPGNFEIHLPRFASPQLGQLLLASNTKMTSPHNEFLQILCEQGVLGTVALAAVLVALFATLRRLPAGADRLCWSCAAVAVLASVPFNFALHVPGSVACYMVLLALLGRAAEPGSQSGQVGPKTRGPLVRGTVIVWISALSLASCFSILVLISTIRHYEAVRQMNAGQWNFAAATFARAASIYPGQDAAFYNQAYIYYYLRRREEGLLAIEDCLALTPHLERAIELRRKLLELP